MNNKDKRNTRIVQELKKLRRQNFFLQKAQAKHNLVADKLKESDRRYRAAFKSINDVTIIIDRQGKILDINDAVTRLTGYERADLVGKNFRSFRALTTDEQYKNIINIFKERMAGKHIPFWELMLRKKNGDVIYVEASARVIKRQGKIIGEAATVRDITARRSAEASVMQKTEDLLLLSLLNHALNQGASLPEIINILSDEIQRIFMCDGMAVYLLSPDAKYLVLQKETGVSARIQQISTKFGFKIPLEIKIRLRKDGQYWQVLQKDRPKMINDPIKIQRLIAEFTENRQLKRLAPKIYKILNIRSVICIPLISNGRPIGLMDLGREKPFVESEFMRLGVLTEHLTAILRHFDTVETMRESEKRYRTLFEKSPTSITLLNTAGVILDCNKATEKLIGYNREEIMGKKFTQLLTLNKKDLPRIKEIYLKVSKGMEIEPLELEITRKNGERRWIDFVNSLLTRDDKIIGFQVITTDITERKRAEEILKQREKEFRLIFESAKAAIFLADVKTGLITNCNAAASILLEREKQEIIGLHQTRLHPRPRAKYYADMFRRHIDEKGAFDDDAEIVTKSGKIKQVHITASMTDIGGKAIIHGIFRDISESKRAEQALRVSEEEYKTLTENINVGIYRNTIGSKGRFIEANPAIVSMFGYKDKTEFFAINVADLYQNPKERRQFNAKMLVHGFVKNEELRLRKKDRTPIIASVSAVAVKDEKGTVKYYDGIIEDIAERKKAEQALKESVEKYRTLTENVNVAVYRNTPGPKGKFIEANPALVRMFGYESREEIFKINVVDLYQNPEDRKKFNGKMLEYGFVRNEELRLKKKDGLPIIASVSAVAVKDEKGKVRYYDGIIEEITERKQAEQALLDSERKFRGLYESVKDGIVLIDIKGKILECNQSFSDMLDYTQDEIKNISYRQLLPIKWHKGEEDIIENQVNKKGFSDEYEKEYIRKDGLIFPVAVRVWMVHDVQGRSAGMWVIVRDITERKRHEQELAHMATHDPLTKLPNRILFPDRLKVALTHAQRKHQKLVVMLLDLDRFKDINDTLGHNVGDQLLQYVGNRLTTILRKGDTVARMGGDEFMLLLPELIRIEDASLIAQKILIAIREPFVFDNRELHITTSIGITVYPNDGETADGLMKNADIAMYRAKEKGRDNYQHYNQTSNTTKNAH